MLTFLERKSVAGCMVFLLEKFCLKNNLNSPVKHEYNPGERVIFELWLKKIQFIYKQLPYEGIGLDIANETDAGSVGVMAYIAYSCKNLREVIHYFSRYNKLWYDYTDKKIGFNNGNVFISWEKPSFTFVNNYILETEISDELQAAIIYKMILHHLPGKKHVLLSVDLAIKRPRNIRKYEEYFNCPVSFETNRNQVVILGSLLDLPFQTSESTLLKILLKYAEQVIGDFIEDNSFVELVNKNIVRAIKNNRPHLDEVAGYIGISPRVLQKKLKEKGVTFLELLDNIRYQKAMDYLLEEKNSISEISYLLGYREQASFNRSFKAWTGMSPNQWRKYKISLQVK
ncbi:helix-turn-helix domain-containing protein [Acinetobacter baumannii]|nr:helix-turn-helix domain-containing protein [Acinetobacter baumannii]